MDQPITKRVSNTNNAALVTLFAAGQVTLHAVDAVQSGTHLPDGRYQVSINGIAGRNYLIEGSSDLINWTPLITNQMTLSGTLLFIDQQATNLTKRFYRTRLWP